MSLTAFLTISFILSIFSAFNFSSAEALFNDNPPIIGNIEFTIEAKVPGTAKACTPIRINAITKNR